MKSFLIRFIVFSIFSCPVWSQAFRVDDIRVEGLQRVSASTVFAALPIEANANISQSELQEAIRELFKTGFFDDISIGRVDDVLVIKLSERPAINRIIFVGNKIIDTEALLDGLKGIGLVEGDIFKQSALEQITRELNAQYSAIGRYASQVETRVEELDQNQVNIGIRITEGNVANIKHVNIVGNNAFEDKELQAFFEIQKTGTWSWITGNDKYAKQKLAGDLDRLKSFYLDNGYLEFDVTSTQVSLSPDKQAVYITINVFEGEPYTVDAVELAGDLVVSEQDIRSLVSIHEGDTFSQERVIATSNAIKSRLGNEGYSLAKVNAVPDLDKTNKTAKVTIYITPGEISYVRRIIFEGNLTTQDNVLRREMRQLEGAPVSTEKLEQSKQRLERLSLFSQVEMAIKDVPGRADQIDVIFTVVEQPSGSVNASLGYSQGSGVTLGAGLQQENWLGTGNAFGFQVTNSNVETNYSINFTNPYFTQDGISRGISFSFRERDLSELDISSFSTDRLALNVTFGYPISEKSRLSFGVGAERIKVKVGVESVQEISGSPRLRSGVDDVFLNNADAQANIAAANFTDTNNNGFLDEDDSINSVSASALRRESGDLTTAQQLDSPEGFVDRHGDSFSSLRLNLGWNESTLDRGIFPTKGRSQNLNLEVTVPGGDLEHYKLTYRGQFYRAISKNITLRLKSRFGYADSYGDIDGLPFFENFFSGGTTSVRGFEQSSLGPKGTPSVSYEAAPYRDSNGNIGFAYFNNTSGRLSTYTDTDARTLGGNILFEVGAEFVFPVPFAGDSKSLRSVFFVDAGNVFSDSCVSTQLYCSDFDLAELSSSTGLGVQWLSPIGPVSFYFTKAIQKQEFDRTESFQFSLGQSF